MSNGSEKSEEQPPEENFKIQNIYLHGEAETPNITAIPTEFTFPDMEYNKEVIRVLLISNKSLYLSMTLKYNKVSNIFMQPEIFKIAPDSSLEVPIIFKPTELGSYTSKIIFDLLHKNKLDIHYHKVGVIEVPTHITVKSVTCYKKPEFVMGITPKCANEVGFYTHDVRFNSKVKKPTATMVQYKADENDDALIAFPNDRQRSLKPWKNTIEYNMSFAYLNNYN